MRDNYEIYLDKKMWTLHTVGENGYSCQKSDLENSRLRNTMLELQNDHEGRLPT